MVHRSSIPLHWRLYESKYNLIGNKCLKCGEYFFPSRSVCPNCGKNGLLKKHLFSDEGIIYSYTVIRVAPEGFEQQVPYIIALVKLKEGTLVVGQITDSELVDVKIGKK